MATRTTGDNIADLRRQRNWTQEDLAARAEVCRGTVASWEGGSRMPRRKHLQRLATVFRVGVKDIVGDRA